MTPYTLQFEVMGLPKSANKVVGKNRMATHAHAQSWKRIIWLATRNKLPPEPLKRCKLKLTRLNFRTLDYDGLVTSFKPIVDGLVEARILHNDTWNITGAWDVTQEYTPKAQARIRVEVIQIEEIG